jgi:hypothetical protein
MVSHCRQQHSSWCTNVPTVPLFPFISVPFRYFYLCPLWKYVLQGPFVPNGPLIAPGKFPTILVQFSLSSHFCPEDGGSIFFRKLWHAHTKLHGVITLKITIFIFIGLNDSNLFQNRNRVMNILDIIRRYIFSHDVSGSELFMSILRLKNTKVRRQEISSLYWTQKTKTSLLHGYGDNFLCPKRRLNNYDSG